MRAAIEEEYAKKLLSLSRKPFGSCEGGTLKAAMDVLRAETESSGKAHQGIAHRMKSDLEEPLARYAGSLRERRKLVQSGIEKLLKIKISQTQAVNKVDSHYKLTWFHLADLSARQEIGMNRTSYGSRVMWPSNTWSWVKKSEKTSRSWRRPRVRLQIQMQTTRML